MVSRSAQVDAPSDGAERPAIDPDAAARASARLAKAQAKAAAKAAEDAAKTASVEAKQQRKTDKSRSRLRRAEVASARRASKAAAKAAKAQAKASQAAAEAASTRPARVIDKVTDPKLAKRAVAIGKVVAPAVAPTVIKGAVGFRGFLDRQRAARLGVPVERVAAYRGPTGPTGARLDGVRGAIRELASRKGNDLQVTRFTEVASTRIEELTAAVQASASMPARRRREVLREVGRQLDDIEKDLVSHLIGAPTS